MFLRESFLVVVLFSRDEEGFGMAHDNISPKHLPQFPDQSDIAVSLGPKRLTQIFSSRTLKPAIITE